MKIKVLAATAVTYLFLLGSASSFASLPSYSLPGITPSGNPAIVNMDTDVKVQQKSNKTKVQAKAKGTAHLYVGSNVYEIEKGKFKLKVDTKYKKGIAKTKGKFSWKGKLPGYGIKSGKIVEGKITSLNIGTGLNAGLIGMNTSDLKCHDNIASLCTTKESIYLDVSGGGVKVKTKSNKTEYYGATSVTTIPVPAAVWLFGSGLIGLVSIARRRKQ